MKKRTVWYVVGVLILGLALLAISCGGKTTAPAEEKNVTPAAEEKKITPPPAKEQPVVTPSAATPPKAPKAIHEALFAATPPGCTGCHVGAAGVGAPGGTGLPGPGSANDHTGRTSYTCKTCHQLSS